MSKCQFLFVRIRAGILWNLSSKENLKEKLAKATLPTLAQKIFVPLSKNEMGRTAHTDSDTEIPPESPSETEIFCNATGCVRCTSFMCLASAAATWLIKIYAYAFPFPWLHLHLASLFFHTQRFFCWLLQPPVTFDSILLMHWCQESCNLYVHNTQSDLKKFSEITCLFSVFLGIWAPRTKRPAGR